MVKEIKKFSDMKNPTELLAGICELGRKHDELTEYEHIMKNVSLCSRNVRDALIRTKNTGLALSHNVH